MMGFGAAASKRAPSMSDDKSAAEAEKIEQKNKQLKEEMAALKKDNDQLTK